MSLIWSIHSTHRMIYLSQINENKNKRTIKWKQSNKIHMWKIWWCKWGKRKKIQRNINTRSIPVNFDANVNKLCVLGRLSGLCESVCALFSDAFAISRSRNRNRKWSNFGNRISKIAKCAQHSRQHKWISPFARAEWLCVCACVAAALLTFWKSMSLCSVLCCAVLGCVCYQWLPIAHTYTVMKKRLSAPLRLLLFSAVCRGRGRCRSHSFLSYYFVFWNCGTWIGGVEYSKRCQPVSQSVSHTGRLHLFEQHLAIDKSKAYCAFHITTCQINITLFCYAISLCG